MPGFASGTNTYVANTAASKSLIVGFSRNARTFKIAQYTQYVPASKMQGLYWVWTSRQGGRILTANDAEHIWMDGDAAPIGPGESFKVMPFMTTRRAYSFLLGGLAVEQADFSLLAAESQVSAQQCMTARTMLTHTALSGAAWGLNTASVDNGILASGQTWATGSDHLGTNQGANIKVSLQYAATVIHKQTLGAVQPSQLTLVVNPNTANLMASSAEIMDYMKQSEFANIMLQGKGERGLNSKWGLPDYLYGHPVAVEDAVRVSSNIGAATEALDYVMPDGIAYLLARQGELEGVEGSRRYSTVQIFFYKDEMTVKTMYDTINERYMGRVVTNFDPKVVAPQSGFRFTNVGLPPTPGP